MIIKVNASPHTGGIHKVVGCCFTCRTDWASCWNILPILFAFIAKDVMQEESNGFTHAIDFQLKQVRFSQLDSSINIERRLWERWLQGSQRHTPYSNKAMLCLRSYPYCPYTVCRFMCILYLFIKQYYWNRVPGAVRWASKMTLVNIREAYLSNLKLYNLFHSVFTEHLRYYYCDNSYKRQYLVCKPLMQFSFLIDCSGALIKVIPLDRSPISLSICASFLYN